MSNFGSLFSGIAQGYAQGVHQQRQDALAKQAQEQQAAYQQAQIMMAGAQAVLTNKNSDKAQIDAANATIQQAMAQMTQAGQANGKGKSRKGGGSVDQNNPLAKVFALIQGHQGGGQAPPIPAPPTSSAPSPSAPPSTPPIPAPAATAGTSGNGGGAPSTPPVPQPPPYLSGPGGLDRQRQQAEFDMQEAQRLQQLKDTIGLMKAQGATPTQINEAVFHVPATSASLAIPHQVSSHVSSAGLPQDAHLQDGTPIQGNPSFDKNTIWNAMTQFNPETGGFDFYYEPVGAPQQSPNSALGQLTQAFKTLQTADPKSPEARAAADIVAKADPNRVRTTSSERIVTITNADGSTHSVRIPITSTSVTSPSRGTSGLPPVPVPSASAGAASSVENTGGHKPLSTQELRQVEGADNLISMAGSIRTVMAGLGMNADDNSAVSRIKDSLKGLAYKGGFGVDTNQISNFSGILQAMAAAMISGGRTNSKYLDIAGQHILLIASTPQAMLQRIDDMVKAANDVKQGIYKPHGLTEDSSGRIIGAPSTNNLPRTGNPAADAYIKEFPELFGGGKGGGGTGH